VTASWSTIDCDVHVNVPNMQALLPHLDEFWRDSVLDRGLNSLESISYPPNAPLTSRPDWRGKGGEPANTLDALKTHALDRWNIDVAICNCLYGVQLLFSEDMAAAFAKGVNNYVAKEWLDRDPRLRASIVVPMQNTELAVAEIERCAVDKRFVQVLVLSMGEAPLGRRQYWPVYEAADGTACRSASTPDRATSIRSRRSVGRLTISKTMPRIRKVFRRRWRALFVKACLSNTRS
jgi:predicted TIM-barrel fold metal-dependent hydrolase